LSNLRRAIVTAALVTPSGALSPGPLSAAAIAVGTQLGALGGVMVALGHLAAEAPYVAALLLFYTRIAGRLKKLEKPLNLVAAAFIAYFAALLAVDGYRLLTGGTLQVEATPVTSPIAALAAGAILTAGNAYFLAWWLSVGKPIIDEMRSLPPHHKVIVYAAHYAYDLAWLTLLAAAGSTLLVAGAKALGAAYIALAAVLAYFAAKLVK